MHTSFAVAAGLVAVAYAGTTTITDTVDVTITSCEPSVTNCPYKAGDGSATWSDWVSASTTTTKPVSVKTTTSAYDPTWSDWTSSTTTTKPVGPATTSSSWDPTWSDWVSTSSTTSSKPVSPVSSSSWDPTWSDWASASSTWATTATPVSAVTTTYATGAWTSVTPVAAASTSSAVWSSYAPSATPVKPATFTGAANVNAGSFAFAGLAAAAALVMA